MKEPSRCGKLSKCGNKELSHRQVQDTVVTDITQSTVVPLISNELSHGQVQDTVVADETQPTVVPMISNKELNQGQVQDTGVADEMQPTVVRQRHPIGFPVSYEIEDSVRMHKALQEALQLLGALSEVSDDDFAGDYTLGSKLSRGKATVSRSRAFHTVISRSR